ncbi:MAG TPA: SHOCT domain-containing protein [Solirubrobacterales bacterium]|nr:SHOCT domain-containing protein [Solirubrobacterales bacterium]
MREDINAATERMGLKIGSKREIKKLPGHLHDGETVIELARGQYGGGTGLLALTSERILFLREGWIGAAHEDFPLHRVTSVGFSSKLGMGKVTIHASGNTVDIDGVMSDDGKRIAAAARNVLQGQSPAAASAGSDGPLGQLKQLGELHEAGVISPEEFEQKKAELLNQI